MKGKRRPLLGLGLLALGLVALTALGPGSVRGRATADSAKLLINDVFLGGPALLSDGKGWYIDRLLPGGYPCVTAWVNQPSGFFIYMDRGSGYATGCNNWMCPETKSCARTYQLIFPAGSGVCEKLGLGSGPCVFTINPYSESPRIRIENIFGKKTTPVALLFRHDGSSYEVRTDAEVSQSGSGNMRTLTYYGYATLWKLPSEPPIKLARIGSSFYFPFELTVERVAQ